MYDVSVVLAGLQRIEDTLYDLIPPSPKKRDKPVKVGSTV